MKSNKKSPASWLAFFIAGGLDPMIVLPITTLFICWWSWRHFTLHWAMLVILLWWYLLLPLVQFVWMWKTHRINDLDISQWKKRAQLFWGVLGAHAMGVISIALLGPIGLVWILVQLWLVVFGFVLINQFTKISVHVGVNATLVSMLMFWVDWRFGLALILVVMVAWARVYDRHHTLQQVLLGGLVPVIVLALGKMVAPYFY